MISAAPSLGHSYADHAPLEQASEAKGGASTLGGRPEPSAVAAA